MNSRAEILKRLESWGAELAKAVVELKEPVMEIWLSDICTISGKEGHEVG